jgi:glycosyltransferase involved in cell wall biosynthesis
MRPSVDIIVPAFNVAPYIEASLKSCMDRASSSTVHATIIVIDDGSEDETADKIKQFVAAHPGTKISFGATNNIGAGSARNVALEKASSDFVCFVDPDDLIDRRILDSTIQEMQKTGADFACPRVKAFDDLGRYAFDHDSQHLRKLILHSPKSYVSNTRDEPMLLSLETSMCMRIFRRNFLNEHGIQFAKVNFCEDVEPSRKAFLLAPRILLTDEVYYYYRLNRFGQATQAAKRNWVELVEVMRRTLDVGLQFILDNEQGAWMLNRLAELARWWSVSIPPKDLSAYCSGIALQFDRAPKAWWKFLYRVDNSSDAAKPIAYIYGINASKKSRERIIENPCFRAIDFYKFKLGSRPK